jgi:hypothetical protein
MRNHDFTVLRDGVLDMVKLLDRFDRSAIKFDRYYICHHDFYYQRKGPTSPTGPPLSCRLMDLLDPSATPQANSLVDLLDLPDRGRPQKMDLPTPKMDLLDPFSVMLEVF